MSDSIKIKNYKVLNALMSVPYHPKLIDLNQWCCVRYSSWMFTSGYRREKIHSKDSGIHCTIPCRANDIRSLNLEDPQSVCDDINKHWIYDPKRPRFKCAKYHNTGRGWHIHLQVHNRTIYLGG